jgi:glycosyltransferase involved in cell wall biosynthesis
MLRSFRRARAERPFDVLVVEHCHAALPAIDAGVPWVLDEHNVESEYLLARAQAAGGVGPWQRREVTALRNWERAAWRAASEVVCVSTADAERVSRDASRAALVIPNGVDVEAVPYVAPSQRRGFDMLFVGLMDHAPNVVAAQFLAREVMPRVMREEPNARLVLCGMNPAAEVRALAGERIVVTGFVPSVHSYLEAATVYVNPLRHGTGTSLKVLEALAAGLPLVSTAVGVRGFGLRPESDYIHADDAESFTRAILRAFRERASFDTSARLGRELAERHAWTELSRRFAEVVERAARPTRTADRAIWSP